MLTSWSDETRRKLFPHIYCSCRAGILGGPVQHITTSWHFQHNDVGQNEPAKTFKFIDLKHPSDGQVSNMSVDIFTEVL